MGGSSVQPLLLLPTELCSTAHYPASPDLLLIILGLTKHPVEIFLVSWRAVLRLKLLTTDIAGEKVSSVCALVLLKPYLRTKLFTANLQKQINQTQVGGGSVQNKASGLFMFFMIFRSNLVKQGRLDTWVRSNTWWLLCWDELHWYCIIVLEWLELQNGVGWDVMYICCRNVTVVTLWPGLS